MEWTLADPVCYWHDCLQRFNSNARLKTHQEQQHACKDESIDGDSEILARALIVYRDGKKAGKGNRMVKTANHSKLCPERAEHGNELIY